MEAKYLTDPCRDGELSEVGKIAKNLLSANLLLLARPSPW
jgi:hypothetical protein